jgi:hypothetical protein
MAFKDNHKGEHFTYHMHAQGPRQALQKQDGVQHLREQPAFSM